MLFNDKNLCLVGTKDIWFVTTEGNLYFGNRDFNKTAARRFISNNGEEFKSDKIYAWGYQSEVLSKDNTKITKIAEILNKYNFTLSTTNIDTKTKDKILQEMMHISLDEIADTLAGFGNCIREIMRVVYNVKEIEKYPF